MFHNFISLCLYVLTVTTNQPGQHPVISIPDTTQNGNPSTSNGLVGQDFDLFSALVNTGGENVTIKTDGRNGASGNAGIPQNPGNNNNHGANCEEASGRLIMGNGNNCVCDLRAMLMCRKCGAFCHDDCMGSSDLCMTCMI